MIKINVNSEVSGTVWEVLVKVGDKIKVNDQLVVLESMKMEIPIVSPAAGSVLEVYVYKGDLIEEDQLILIIDT